jgi:four helix bundle protein
MQDFRRLAVWEKAHMLALSVHRLTAKIPRHGNSGFVSQIRRAALSIPANIAEGSGRASNRDFANFIQISIASSSELEYHLEFAAGAELVATEECAARQAEVVEVRRMLIGLQKKLRPTP